MRSLILRLSLPLLLLCCAASANADPLVITGGSATINQPAGIAIASFTLLAPNFLAGGSGGMNSGRGGRIIGRSDFFLIITNNGVTQNGFFAGNSILNFTLSPFTLPDPNTAPDTFTVNTAFTMTGQMELLQSQFGPPIVLFSSPVTGSGNALITYMRSNGSITPFIPTNIVYNFAPPTATPEPATLLLLSTGLTGIAGVVRRRRQHSRE